jgi:hypothetical protein
MSPDATGDSPTPAERPGGVRLLIVAAWVWVGIPFCYGLSQLIAKIPGLFGG